MSILKIDVEKRHETPIKPRSTPFQFSTLFDRFNHEKPAWLPEAMFFIEEWTKKNEKLPS